MPAPLWTEKTQTFIAPDGSELTYHSTRDYKFVVIVSDPDWRIIACSETRRFAEKRLDYYKKIWPDYIDRMTIVKRHNKEYIA